MKNCLITGVAGFIGSALAYDLVGENIKIIGVDNINTYYDTKLKRQRIDRINRKIKDLSLPQDSFSFTKMDLAEGKEVNDLVRKFKPDIICHFAAQAGVRYSIENPHTYVRNNITSTINLLEASKDYGVSDFVFASTSSVYGLSKQVPFSEDLPIDSTVSVYSSTKRACELLCHTYHDLYPIKFRILRFFTVYGPWGRPDMALSKFCSAILNNKPIQIFNDGDMVRDFTYIDDIIQGFKLAMADSSDFEIFNLGCGTPIKLMEFIGKIEENLGLEAEKEYLPLQPGDVPVTMADIEKSRKILGYSPKVDVDTGVFNFVKWYKEYHGF